MSAGRTIGLAFLGLLVGGIAGGGVGLLGGLAYTKLAAISGFEGESGFVVAGWMIVGILAGVIGGLILGVKRARR